VSEPDAGAKEAIMTIPEYSDEGRMWEAAAGPVAPGPEDLAEREARERAEADEEVEYLDPESNEAHAPGQVCERCGAMITASQDARRLLDGHWVHEVCPPGRDLPA
jgi:hypothetical protein